MVKERTTWENMKISVWRFEFSHKKGFRGPSGSDPRGPNQTKPPDSETEAGARIQLERKPKPGAEPGRAGADRDWPPPFLPIPTQTAICGEIL